MATAKETPNKDNIGTINEKDNKSTQEVDLEKTGLRPDLERQVSEPPFSVFSKGMKIWIIFLVSISALISPFGASMFLPALNVLTDVLDITPTQVNISITTYMVCFFRSSVMCVMVFDTLEISNTQASRPQYPVPTKADISRSPKPLPQPSLVPYQITVAED
jgi:hypothetical protein